jgi:DNA-binding NarL/FixJ family response regulator
MRFASQMHSLEFADDRDIFMTTAISPGVYMQSNRKAILCLCHDATMLHLRRMLLERFGYRVWPTSSVEDATLLAESLCPDMLLMDNNYPGGNLEEVAQQVKEVCPGVIAVVLSPYFAVHDSSQTAVDRFVPRDEDPDALIARIEELFAERGQGSELSPPVN